MPVKSVSASIFLGRIPAAGKNRKMRGTQLESLSLALASSSFYEQTPSRFAFHPERHCKATNLTEATGSRILSGKDQFAPKTRARVEAVANKLLFPRDDAISAEYFDEIHSRRIPLVVVVRHLANVHLLAAGGVFAPISGQEEHKSPRPLPPPTSAGASGRLNR